MNDETNLKIQSYLDGELSAGEQGQVSAMITQDAKARALYDALVATKTALSGNEHARALPESRAFFWSKIEREIYRSASSDRSASPSPFAWSKWWVRLVMASGCAALLLTLVLTGLDSTSFRPHEVESPLAKMSTITFRSESANMTVVWMQPPWD